MWDAITDRLRYALGQRLHPTLIAQQTALVQSTMSVQGSISTRMVSPTLPFNEHLDPADMEFLKKKVEHCKGRQGNVMLEEGEANPDVKVIAVFEQSLPEGKCIALTKPRRSQLQGDREKRLSAGTRNVIDLKSLDMLSHTPSAGSPAITTVPSTVPSTTSIDVAVSPPLPTPSVQSQIGIADWPPGGAVLSIVSIGK